MIAIHGAGSRLAKMLRVVLETERPSERIVSVPRGGVVFADRHLFCRGVIRPKLMADQTPSEHSETMAVNAFNVMLGCDAILEVQPHARVCVIGSESAYSWSHDGVYAASKAALHRYVETKRIGPSQQLVCIAPTIILDSGMTAARGDRAELVKRMQSHPKLRWLSAIEVARMVYFLLYIDEGYTTGTVIRMHGGGGC